METQRATNQLEAERLQQEQSFRIRDIKKKQKEEVDALTAKHESDMKSLDKAYQVELTSKKDEYEGKTAELNESQTARLALLSKQGELNVKQAAETYRVQADEMRAQGEKRLSSIREQNAEAESNMARKKGNA